MPATGKRPDYMRRGTAKITRHGTARFYLTLSVLAIAQCTTVSRSIEVAAPERQTIALGPAFDIVTEGCQITVDDAELEARVPTRNADRRLEMVQTEIRPFILAEGEGAVQVDASATRTLRFARSGTFFDFLRGNYTDATTSVALPDNMPTRTPAGDPLDCPLLPQLDLLAMDWELATDAAAAAGILAGVNPPPDVLLVDVEVEISFDGETVTVAYTRAVRVNVTSIGEVLYAIGNGDGILHDALATTPVIRRP